MSTPSAPLQVPPPPPEGGFPKGIVHCIQLPVPHFDFGLRRCFNGVYVRIPFLLLHFLDLCVQIIQTLSISPPSHGLSACESVAALPLSGTADRAIAGTGSEIAAGSPASSSFVPFPGLRICLSLFLHSAALLLLSLFLCLFLKRPQRSLCGYFSLKGGTVCLFFTTDLV